MKKEIKTYPESDKGSQSLEPEERETIISWNDEDRAIISIYSSQQPMIRRLLKNPLFKCQRKVYNSAYRNPGPISVDGVLPKKALTIRTKLVRRVLTDQQKKELTQRLKNSRKRSSFRTVQ